MNIARVVIWIAYSVLAFALLMFGNALIAISLGEGALFRVFAVLALLLFIVTAITILAVHTNVDRESSKDAMMFLVGFWLILPIIATLPIGFSGAIVDWRQAYFEAVSALTTTGATSVSPESLPKTLLIWRACLQWSGGVFVASFAVVILSALNFRGTGVHRSIFNLSGDGKLFTRFFSVIKIIAAVYALIALICFVGLLFSGTDIFDAACLSLSAISTGGLTPRSGALAHYIRPTGAVILALTCLLGAANVSILWEFIHKRSMESFRRIVTNVEHRGIFALFALLFLIGFFYVGYEQSYTLFVEAAYLVSGTGFDYDVIGLDILPPAVLIAVALVGGSALSTAGGIKIIRLLLLFRHLKTDLNRMTHPSRVMKVKFQGKSIDDRAFLSIWMYFITYTVFFGLGIIALGAAKLDITTSVSASAAALSNMGPLLPMTLSGASYGDMNVGQLMILAFIMLVGRIEILAALAAVSPSIWRK